MVAANAGIRPNDCLVTDNVVTSTRNLIDGFPLTPINFADLCNLIEMLIIHERIVMTIPALVDSPLQSLVDNGVITSTMFKDATPTNKADKELVESIYTKCLRAVEKGGIFGEGILNVPESPEEGIKWATTRLTVGDRMLSVECGQTKVEPDAQELFAQARGIYQVFKDYVDSVFLAARNFHVHAYTGASEIPCVVQNTIQSVPMVLYNELKKLHKDRVDRFLVSAGYKTYDIPPFALIVLSRCHRRDDIVPELLRARQEFSDFRQTCTTYAMDLRDAAQAGTLEDIVKLHNDHDRAIDLITGKVKASDKDSRFVYRVWDVVKAANPVGMAVNLIDHLKNYDVDRQHLRSVNGLMDVWTKLKKASPYEAILRSNLFPNEFDAKFFETFELYLQHVRQYFPVGTSPDAR